jgi:hypothetical protein
MRTSSLVTVGKRMWTFCATSPGEDVPRSLRASKLALAQVGEALVSSQFDERLMFIPNCNDYCISCMLLLGMEIVCCDVAFITRRST